MPDKSSLTSSKHRGTLERLVQEAQRLTEDPVDLSVLDAQPSRMRDMSEEEFLSIGDLEPKGQQAFADVPEPPETGFMADVLSTPMSSSIPAKLDKGLTGDIARWLVRMFDPSNPKINPKERAKYMEAARQKIVEGADPQAIDYRKQFEGIGELESLAWYEDRATAEAIAGAIPVPEMRQIWALLKERPGLVVGEFLNLMMENPALFLSKAGWETGAKMLGMTIPLKFGAAFKKAAQVAGGAAGAAATGGAIVGAMELADQAGRGDKLDWERIGEHAGIGAVLSPLFIGPLMGIKSLRNVLKRDLALPGPDDIHGNMMAGGADVVAEVSLRTGTFGGKMRELGERFAEGFRGTVGKMVYKSAAQLNRPVKNSPTAQRLRNNIEHEEFLIDKNFGPDWWVRRQMSSGAFHGILNGLMESFNKRVGRTMLMPLRRRMTPEMNDALFDVFNGIKRVPSKATAAARAMLPEINRLRDSMWGYAKAAGLVGNKGDPKRLADWLWRVFSPTKIAADENGFMKMLVAKYPKKFPTYDHAYEFTQHQLKNHGDVSDVTKIPNVLSPDDMHTCPRPFSSLPSRRMT